MHTLDMLDTTPTRPDFDRAELADCIDACFDCAQTCVACADACLGEEMVAELRQCIGTNLTCADVCDATGRALSRSVGPDTTLVMALLGACRMACEQCAAECGRHSDHHAHCRVCADACRTCADACERLLAAGR